MVTVLVALVFQFCSQNGAFEDEEVFPDKVQISAAVYNEFVVSYNVFFGALSAEKKEILAKFIDERYFQNQPGSNPGGRSSKSECHCAAGQSSCSAETWASDCCICCEIGKSSVCGSYFGIASCKCDSGGESISDGARIGAESGDRATVNIYPNRFFEIFAFAEKNTIGTKEIKEKLKMALKK